MGITHRYLEDKACEKAEDLAIKQTGLDFESLPATVQSDIWAQAFQQCVESQYEAAEMAVERSRGIER
jgi:hypothetical protein